MVRRRSIRLWTCMARLKRRLRAYERDVFKAIFCTVVQYADTRLAVALVLHWQLHVSKSTCSTVAVPSFMSTV